MVFVKLGEVALVVVAVFLGAGVVRGVLDRRRRRADRRPQRRAGPPPR